MKMINCFFIFKINFYSRDLQKSMMIQEQIKKLKSELHALYEEQWVLEKEIENEKIS